MGSTSLLIAACVILVLGFYFKEMFWTILIALILFAAGLMPSKKKAKGGAPAGDVAVRPIIVQRKYEGDESIYPKVLKLKVDSPSSAWWEDAQKHVGKTIGSAIHKMFGEEEK